MLPAEDIRLLLTIIMASVITIPIPAAVIAFIITTLIATMRGACIRLTAEAIIILIRPHVAILPLRAVAEVLHPAAVVVVVSAVRAAEIN